MATLYVRDFPDNLYQRLQEAAAERRRSLSAEVIVLIEGAIERAALRDQRMDALDRIARRRGRQREAAAEADTLTMLREDRAR